MRTANGRIGCARRRWAGGEEGSVCPVDRLVDETAAAGSVGVRQWCCREGTQARSFARGRENLQHAAQPTTGEEMFRRRVERAGQAVLKASDCEQWERDGSGKDGRASTPEGQTTPRLYASAGGVLAPATTPAEKDPRRETVEQWRKDTPRSRRGKLRRLPAVKQGSDQRYQRIYVTVFYDQAQEHRRVGVPCHPVRGRKKLLPRDGERVGLLAAQERRGLIAGAVCLKSHLEAVPRQGIALDF